MTKDFLPRTTTTFSPLQEVMGDKGTFRVPNKCGPCLKKTFPILAIFAMFTGTALLGLSVVIVFEGQVGYYDTGLTCANKTCVVKAYTAGTYLELPWKKGEFKIVQVSPRNITIELDSDEGGGKYKDKSCQVSIETKNLDAYLTALIQSGSEDRFLSRLVNRLNSEVSTFLDGEGDIASFRREMYGLSCFNLVCV